MRTFATLAAAGLTGAALLKLLAALLAPLWASLAAIIAGWLAALGATLLGWALLALKVALLAFAIVFAVKWVKKRTAPEEA